MVQTTYGITHAAGLPGMRADMSEWDASSWTATAPIVIGAPAQRAAGYRMAAPFASGGEFIGLASFKRKYVGDGSEASAARFETGETFPLGNEGVYFGVADAAIASGAPLNWNTATGRWTTAATSGTVLAVPGIEADSAATAAGQLFEVRLRRIPS